MIGDIIQIPLLGGDTDKNIHQTIRVTQTDEYFTASILALRVHVTRAENLDDTSHKAYELISGKFIRRCKTRERIVKNWFSLLSRERCYLIMGYDMHRIIGTGILIALYICGSIV